MKILDKVNSPDDIKKLSSSELEALAGEIREFLIENVLKTGGHLASNLGVVELTLALYRVFDAGKDDIIWDVGHQSYVHKIITGRKDKFATLRQFDGISGFPKVSESALDCFDTGHSSTSLSAALGFATAKGLNGESGETVAVIGDASFSGGPALEALNHISQTKKKVIIILNDNQMSIGKNRGAFARYLNRVRTKPSYYNIKRETESLLSHIPVFGNGIYKIVKRAKSSIKYMITPGVVFEQLGYKYLGPVDGHNIENLCAAYREAKASKKPCVIHICTVKGKGYPDAESHPSEYHGVSAPSKSAEKPVTFSAQAGKTICDLAQENKSVVCVCPSMVDSCGLSDFAKLYPERLFDTGIAEAHAVTLAAGLSAKGLTPIVCVYSSFLQRAYDGILHDVAICNRHVVFAIDRAGVVGEDGETHQGIFDIAFLSSVPNLKILAPADTEELDKMLRYAVNECDGPVAVRYPRGYEPLLKVGAYTGGEPKAEVIKEGTAITLAGLGNMLHTALETAKILEERGVSAEVVSLRCAKPEDFETVAKSVVKTGFLAVFEDCSYKGGVGETLFSEIPCKHLSFSWGDRFIKAGSKKALMDFYGLTPQKAAEEIGRKL
ncbi:MAG: 1-deoxy-D-xylulose-5-phosphate synthase [Clostridia bacterium]|nr:1-deoxy-D-xylulose-5-phosphate synthase [Clostridia bacterium]